MNKLEVKNIRNIIEMNWTLKTKMKIRLDNRN